jgi:hypothetical protein
MKPTRPTAGVGYRTSEVPTSSLKTRVKTKATAKTISSRKAKPIKLKARSRQRGR